MRIIASLSVLICCFFMVSCAEYEKETKRPPEFRWEAFQRFWSKNETQFVTLEGAREIASGYFVDYGRGVQLFINTKGDIITDVNVTYNQSMQNNEGGYQYLRLIEQVMDVGMFRWTGAERVTMRNFFGAMSNVQKEFKYKTSHFIRSVNAATWSFKLIFIVNTNEIWTNIPLEN